MNEKEEKLLEKLAILTILIDKFHIMRKYISVYRTVCELTESEALRTFFTLILMSNSLEQRREFEKKFVEDLATLPIEEQEELKLAWRNSLKNLLVATKALHQEAIDYNATLFPKRQAA